MSLVFAGITPHPPMLVPTIGKEQANVKLQETTDALRQLEQDLYLARPDIILMISPHEGMFEQAFVVNAHTSFVSHFEQFGDFQTTYEWKGSPDFASKIGHVANNETDLPIRLVSEPTIGHGTSVPLSILTSHLPDVKIIPIGFSNRDPLSHIQFGELLKEIIMKQDKRIAVIASGDLSHTLSDQSPAGYSEKGSQFDKKLIELLETKNTAGIAQMDQEMIAESKECGYRSILILLGVIKDLQTSFKQYAYQAPFGVGYLTGIFHI